jgi:hypothetical protein
MGELSPFLLSSGKSFEGAVASLVGAVAVQVNLVVRLQREILLKYGNGQPETLQ